MQQLFRYIYFMAKNEQIHPIILTDLQFQVSQMKKQ